VPRRAACTARARAAQPGPRAAAHERASARAPQQRPSALRSKSPEQTELERAHELELLELKLRQEQQEHALMQALLNAPGLKVSNLQAAFGSASISFDKMDSPAPPMLPLPSLCHPTGLEPTAKVEPQTMASTLSCIRLHARLVADGKRLGAEEMLAQYELASKAELTVGRLGDAVCTWYLLGDEKTDARIEGNVRTLLAPQRAAAA